ncbi:hypothetical protein LAZ40_03300 [Cereibacter sphaeroides]|uniref:hypothetical protein n=1 Tax=Cereibacter sphaeroides TaxID=1063 RepID=UPI001F1788CE|nr:hypothetical protein [Cereibacter sphaeroides]MCE6958082.1 hypothetical protein [Cereibacter sphaeroides]MCE6971431.1 hypothetical protein [Cereibacter sphaeroides]
MARSISQEDMVHLTAALRRTGRMFLFGDELLERFESLSRDGMIPVKDAEDLLDETDVGVRDLTYLMGHDAFWRFFGFRHLDGGLPRAALARLMIDLQRHGFSVYPGDVARAVAEDARSGANSDDELACIEHGASERSGPPICLVSPGPASSISHNETLLTENGRQVTIRSDASGPRQVVIAVPRIVNTHATRASVRSPK